MAILTKSGRVAIANAITSLPLHFAWGSGDGAWLTPPSESPNAASLIAEIGRRTATAWAYVVADAAGDIVTSTGSFSLSPGNAPTSNIWVKADFAFSDAQSSVIREVAVYSDTTVIAGLPPGQAYFTPSQIADPGILLYLENITPIFRSPTIQENFEAVISF